MSLSELEELINKFHNPRLVKEYESPNANIQILLFNDGEIMQTKGGWAFLKRSLFSIKPKIEKLDKNNIKMPQAYYDYSFIIVESEDIANNIRNVMVNYCNK